MTALKGSRTLTAPTPGRMFVCARCGRTGERHSRSTGRRVCCRDCRDADRTYATQLTAKDDPR